MSCNRYEKDNPDEDDWGIENIDVPEREIEYQEDDGNSDCGDSCTI